MNSDKLLMPVTIAMLGLLAVNIFWNWPSAPPRWLRCPQCGQEYREGEECASPKCRSKYHAPGRAEKDAAGKSSRKAGAIGIVALTVILIGAFIFLSKRTAAVNEELEPTYLRCKCPQCKRRLRYTPQPFSRKIVCPGCRSDVEVPAAEVVAAEDNE